LKNPSLDEGQWDLFQQQFEQIEPHFVKNLIQNFPKITQKDLKLLILIRMNLESRENGDIIGFLLKVSIRPDTACANGLNFLKKKTWSYLYIA